MQKGKLGRMDSGQKETKQYELKAEREKAKKVRQAARKNAETAEENKPVHLTGAEAEEQDGNESGEETGEEKKGRGESEREKDGTITPAKRGGQDDDSGDSESESEAEGGGGDDEKDKKLELLTAKLAVMKERYKLEKREKKAIARQLQYPTVPTSAGAIGVYTRPEVGAGGGASVYNVAVGTGAGGGSLPHPSQSNLRMPELAKMKTFNGEMDSDVLDSWIRTLLTHTAYYEIGGSMYNDALKIMYASAHLEGAASDWWYSTGNIGITTMKEFVTALNSRFKSSLDADVAAEKLNNLKQGSHPATHYVGWVQQLLIRLPNMDMETRIRSFIRGLSPHLAQRLRELRPKTVQEAYEQAIRIEGSFVTSKGKFGELSKLNNVELDEGEMEEEEKPVTLAAMKKYLNDQKYTKKTTTTQSGAGGGSDYSTIQCFGCEKFGHYKSNCPNKSEWKRGKVEEWHKTVTCNKCGVKGHIKMNCPGKKSGEGQGK